MRRPPAIPALLLAACLAGIVLSPGQAAADIFRWVDDDGVLHFTDDPASIPASRRGTSSVVIRQDAGSRDAAPAAEAAPAPTPPTPAAPDPDRDAAPAAGDPSDEARQLRAKIEAKESFIRQIDAKRSPAGNPYRNRIVDPADLDLYNKYQAELPGDRATLNALEGGGD